jgi:hypothetical protein
MFRNKLREQRGDFAIGLALAMPIIMLVLFLAIDLVRAQVTKTSIQRTMDSAALAVIAQATNKEFYTDTDGYIVEPADSPRVGLRPCELTQEDLDRGLAIIQKELAGFEYTLIEPTAEQLAMGYVEFRVKVKVKGFLNSDLIPFDFVIPVYVKTQSACRLYEQ